MKLLEKKIAGIAMACLLAAQIVSVDSVWAMARGPKSSLVNSIKVEKVKLSKTNAIAGNWHHRVSCDAGFTGTHAGNRITIEAEAEGGDGHYTHTLVYMLGDSYQLGVEGGGEKIFSRKGNGNFKVEIPTLRDEVPFVQQSFYLMTEDRSGNTVSTSKIFKISRPVILNPSNDPEIAKNNCYQRYLPYESAVGPQSNGSTSLSSLQITQGKEKIWTSSKGWQFGVFFNPMIGYQGFLLSLMSLNYTYFAETSKQTSEKVEIAQSFNLNPGDELQVYVQPTRFVNAYDATKVKPCGEEEETIKGAYLFQWWGFAYHVYLIDPSSHEKPLMEAIGVPVENTCSQDLADPFVQSEVPSNTNGYQFFGTNSSAGQFTGKQM
jgi:hypothetical protein